MRCHTIELAGVLLTAFVGTAAAQSANDSEPVTEVFFRFDSAELTPQASAKLDAAANEVQASEHRRILIDAHADPRGTAPYNVGLSIRRAEAVRDHLIANGVDEDAIVLAYYGEDGVPRDTFAEDRRVAITLTDDPLYVLVDDSLPVATAMTWGRPVTAAQIDGPVEDEVIETTARR